MPDPASPGGASRPAQVGTTAIGGAVPTVYDRHGVQVVQADCLDALAELADASVDSVIVDPPYGLSENRPANVVTAITAWANGDRARVPSRKGGFMGQEWDSFVPPPAVWDECLRVLRPGGHLACFAGSRTLDLMTLSVRMAGFEIRDTIAAWLYSSGFAKSLDVGKAIDRAAGAQREVIGRVAQPAGNKPGGASLNMSVVGMPATADITAPATADARRWDGWGTALAPAFEPIILARKPLSGTVAQTVTEHGTGGVNIDACRTAHDAKSAAWVERWSGHEGHPVSDGYGSVGSQFGGSTAGRWPKNAVLAHHPKCADECHPDCHVRALDEQTGHQRDGVAVNRNRSAGSMTSWYGTRASQTGSDVGYGGSGGGSRFFPTFRYQAKAPRAERPQVDGVAHPTVKPLALLRWLVRLVTPPGGLVLDCFAGTGTTGQAARAEDMRAVLVESHAPYIPLILARLDGDQADDLLTDVATDAAS